jgi:hypothetical protein
MLQEALAEAEQKVAEVREQLEAAQRTAAEEASQLQETHAVEVARIALELSNAQVGGGSGRFLQRPAETAVQEAYPTWQGIHHDADST